MKKFILFILSVIIILPSASKAQEDPEWIMIFKKGGDNVKTYEVEKLDSVVLAPVDGKPYCVNIQFSTDNVNLEKVGDDNFMVTVTYSEPMYTDQAPTFKYTDNSNVTKALKNPSYEWNDAETACTVTYDVDATVSSQINDIYVTVTGGLDKNLNPQEECTSTEAFSIDLKAPAAVRIETSSIDVLNDPYVYETEDYIITILFSEKMDTNGFINIGFSVPVETTTFEEVHKKWLSDTRYEILYKTLDANVYIPEVQIYFAFARDLAGNYMLEDSLDDPIFIDTHNPKTTKCYTNLSVIDKGDIGAGTFTITCEFSQYLKESPAPTLSFSPQKPSCLMEDNAEFLEEDVYRWTYDVSETNEDVIGVDVIIKKGKDTNDNVMADETYEDLFDVGMGNIDIFNDDFQSYNAGTWPDQNWDGVDDPDVTPGTHYLIDNSIHGDEEKYLRLIGDISSNITPTLYRDINVNPVPSFIEIEVDLFPSANTDSVAIGFIDNDGIKYYAYLALTTTGNVAYMNGDMQGVSGDAVDFNKWISLRLQFDYAGKSIAAWVDGSPVFVHAETEASTYIGAGFTSVAIFCANGTVDVDNFHVWYKNE